MTRLPKLLIAFMIFVVTLIVRQSAQQAMCQEKQPNDASAIKITVPLSGTGTEVSNSQIKISRIKTQEIEILRSMGIISQSLGDAIAVHLLLKSTADKVTFTISHGNLTLQFRNGASDINWFFWLPDDGQLTQSRASVSVSNEIRYEIESNFAKRFEQGLLLLPNDTIIDLITSPQAVTNKMLLKSKGRMRNTEITFSFSKKGDSIPVIFIFSLGEHNFQDVESLKFQFSTK